MALLGNELAFGEMYALEYDRFRTKKESNEQNLHDIFSHKLLSHFLNAATVDSSLFANRCKYEELSVFFVFATRIPSDTQIK